MLDHFASQVGAFVGTSIVLFIATKPKDPLMEEPQTNRELSTKGAKRYSPAVRRKRASSYDGDAF